MVDLRVRGPGLESGLACGLFGFGAVLQVSEHSSVGPGLRLPRVDGLNPLEERLRLAIILGIKTVIYQQEEAADVIAVALEGIVERIRHHRDVAGGKGPGEASHLSGV